MDNSVFELDHELILTIAKSFEKSFSNTIFDLDDLIQEAKLKLILNYSKIPSKSFRGYLATMIRNHFNSLLKKAKYQAMEPIQISDVKYQPIFFADTNISEQRVIDLLIAGYNATEICQLLGITYYKYRKILRSLREKIVT